MLGEVAVSSLGYDQTDKAAAYAASAIPVYWVVDVERRVVHVLDDPDPATRRYRRKRQVEDGGAIEGPAGRSFTVAEILPAL